MLQDKLMELLYSLDDAEYSYSTSNAAKTDDAPTGDLLSVINLDRSCRVSLEPMEQIIYNIDIPHMASIAFSDAATNTLDIIANINQPKEVGSAYNHVNGLIRSGRHFSLQEIFTLISIIIMIVSLCISRLEGDQHPETIKNLDQLLNIKLQNLKLMNDLITTEDQTDLIS